MLSREEIRLLNKILGGIPLISDEENKLKTKLGLICEQLDIMEKAQEDAAKIQEKIQELESDEDEKKES